MLIRSQNKKELHTLDTIKMLKVVTNSQKYFVEVNSQHTIGTYSAEEKAIKVLDMIQDAYARCESVKTLSSGIMFEVTERIRNQEKAEDFKNEHRATFVFQMPQDSEV